MGNCILITFLVVFGRLSKNVIERKRDIIRVENVEACNALGSAFEKKMTFKDWNEYTASYKCACTNKQIK